MHQIVFSGFIHKNVDKTIRVKTATRLREICEQDNITGLFMYMDGNLISILEGAESDVRNLFVKFNQHPRVTGVTILHEGQIDVRGFQDLKMGFNKNDGLATLPEAFSLSVNSMAAVIPREVGLWVKSLTDSFARVNKLT